MPRPTHACPVLPLLALLAGASEGCVLGVDDAYTVGEAVDAVVVVLGNGDASIVGSGRDDVRVTVALGGFGATDYGHRVRDGVLYLDYDCGDVDLCGGDLEVSVPRHVDLDLELGSGDLRVTDIAGDIVARLAGGAVVGTGLAGQLGDFVTAAGSARVSYRTPPDLLGVAVATGEIAIEVPAGSYALDLHADAGAVRVRGVVDDPGASREIVAAAGVGDIAVTGR